MVTWYFLTWITIVCLFLFWWEFLVVVFRFLNLKQTTVTLIIYAYEVSIKMKMWSGQKEMKYGVDLGWQKNSKKVLLFLTNSKLNFFPSPFLKWDIEVKLLSLVRLFATPWTVAYQACPSMGFSWQEYWSGLPFPSPGDLPNPGIEPGSPTLRADASPSDAPEKPEMRQDISKWK